MKVGSKIYEVHAVNGKRVLDRATVVWVNDNGTRCAYQLDAGSFTDPEGPVFGGERAPDKRAGPNVWRQCDTGLLLLVEG